MTRLLAAALLLAASLATVGNGPEGLSPPSSRPPALAVAVAQGAREVVEVAPGLRYQRLVRGAAARESRHRVVVGTFRSQREADEALSQVEAAGLPASVHFVFGSYRVAVAELPDEAAAAAARGRLLAAGIPGPLTPESYDHDLTHPGGPWQIHLLEAGPRRIRAEVALALDAIVGLETTRSLAVRRDAAAAVNGGYFRMQGPYRGDPLGLLQIDGNLLSEPDRGRASVAFWEEGGRARFGFGRLSFRGEVSFPGGASLPVDGINRPRGAREIIVYTPELHPTTLTSAGGTELVVVGGKLQAIHLEEGGAAIPADGFVVSMGSAVALPPGVELAPGSAVELRTTLEPLLSDPGVPWGEAMGIISGGPLLLLAGERVEDHRAEAISRVFYQARHPRTAVGARADGTLLLVVVDGRRFDSVGMSLPELTDLFLELGAVSALNLDGGGSSTLVVGERTMNAPSELGIERPNGDAILLFPRPRR